MKLLGCILFSCFYFNSISAYSQTDKEQILKVRAASNKALRAFDNEAVLSHLTEDALTTVSNGTLLTGRDALRKYINESNANKMYWIRTPKNVEVNVERGLAWETGTWKGYDEKIGDKAIVGGNYSAMWTKETGAWLIKSQLFVPLTKK